MSKKNGDQKIPENVRLNLLYLNIFCLFIEPLWVELEHVGHELVKDLMDVCIRLVFS